MTTPDVSGDHSDNVAAPLSWETVKHLRAAGSFGSAEIAARILRKRNIPEKPPPDHSDNVAAGKTPFQRVTDDLTNGCGCACHTGTGYRTSCEHCRGGADSGALAETLRSALAAKSQSVLAREEQFAALDYLLAYIKQLEGELAENQRDLVYQDGWREAEQRAEIAEQENERLRVALREIMEHGLGFRDPSLESTRSIARAALSSEETPSEWPGYEC